MKSKIIHVNNKSTLIIDDFKFKCCVGKNGLNFKDLSMGMSGDYLDAVINNATYVRIGSKIFGERN